MTEYESKMLQDRAGRIVGGSVSLVIISPIFGLVAGVVFSSTDAMYVGTAIFAIFGIIGIVSGVREYRETKRKS